MARDSRSRFRRTARAAKAEQGQVPRFSSGNARAARRGAEPGEAERDHMAALVQQRLETIAGVQEEERILCDPRSERRWWYDVGDSHRETFTKPEPTRWHEAARLYGKVSDALARGDLARAAGLLRAAMRAEQKAFDEVTYLVDTSQIETKPDNPWDDGVVPHPLGEAPVPKSTASLVSRILSDRTEIADPPVRRRILPPNLAVEEEEEEAEDDA
jgi:hypothetical protein